MNSSLVIIPTYNEKENVVRMLDTVMGLAFPFDVLVVDDGSPDGTAALVKEAQPSTPSAFTCSNGKASWVSAQPTSRVQVGFGRNYEFIFEMDCDFSHNPRGPVASARACDEGVRACLWVRATSKAAAWPTGP